MVLIIKAISGPVQGKSWPLRDGLSIGRQDKDITLDDGKVSSNHALVRCLQDGRWFVLDQGSKNGVRSGGQRLEELELQHGTEFQIGDTVFVVEDPNPLPPEAKKPKAERPPPAPEDPEREGGKHWTELVKDYLEKASHSAKNQNVAIAAISPALKLTFVRGLQVQTSWLLAYGPRKIGSASPDLALHEPGSPELAFEVIPSRDGPMFKTSHPGKVTINGQSIQQKLLKRGDLIKVSDSEIEVDFS